MRYRINQIKLKPGQSTDILPKVIKNTLGKKNLNISNVRIIKESVDARKKPNVKLVYTVDFDCDERLELSKAEEALYEAPFTEDELKRLALATENTKARPVVCGYGPAGMFAALMLASWGLKPIVIERGQTVDQRIKSVEEFWETGRLNTESNVQFGEGGAGTFSDGKLTTNIKDKRIGYVLRQLVNEGAKEEILYKQKPHIGTDMLRGIVKNIRTKTQSMGADFRFNTRLDGIKTDENGNLSAVIVRDNITGAYEEISTKYLVLATGHSAYDTFQTLYSASVSMEQKPFSIGLRVEHPQELIDKAQYGDPALAQYLGPAEYKLNHKCKNGRGVYTFCMCPGGQVVNSASENETVVTNGMSNSGRDSGTANSAILVDVYTEDFKSDHPLAGFEFQRKFESKAYNMSNGGSSMPSTTFAKFCEDKEDKVRCSLPEFAQESIIEGMISFGKKLKGFDSEDSILTGVETRSSSPVRIRRDDMGMSSVYGIMPSGEGPGYAGGIMSAAVDGIKTSEKLAQAILRELSE